MQDPASGEADRIVDLPEPITINMKVDAASSTSERRPKCSFWNTQDESWDLDGCKEKEGSDPNSECIVCECTHLTSFSMSFDVKRDFSAALESSGIQYFNDLDLSEKNWARVYGKCFCVYKHAHHCDTLVVPISAFLLLTLLFFVIWGKQEDVHSKILDRTLFSRKHQLVTGRNIRSLRRERVLGVQRSEGRQTTTKAKFSAMFSHACKVNNPSFVTTISNDTSTLTTSHQSS